MNTLFETEIRHLLAHPEYLSSAASGKEEFLSDLQSLLESRQVTADDLNNIVRMADLGYRSVFSMACRSCYSIVNERWIRECIKNENLQELLYIASECMIRKDDDFYLINYRIFDEKNKLPEEILEMMRNLFLKKGLPVNALLISSPASFYKPESLDTLICTEEDFRIYLSGKLYEKAPQIFRMSINLFNSLNDADKEKVLGWWLESYRNFNVSGRNPYQIDICLDETEVNRACIWKADLEALETNSPLKTELISLQNRYFGLSEDNG